MSKFLLNLLVQISKALVYSKNQILFRKEFSPSLLAHPAFRPSPFFYRPIFPPFPTKPRPPGRPSPPHGLPVRPSQTELVRFQNLSVFTTCPILLLARFLHFKTCPIRPENLSDPVASPTGHRARARPTWPTRPKPRWRICRKAYSLQLCALWQRHLLSLTSLPCGVHLPAPFPSSPAGRQLPLITSGHPAPPGLQPRDAR
jgi:hypothetical protein